MHNTEYIYKYKTNQKIRQLYLAVLVLVYMTINKYKQFLYLYLDCTNMFFFVH